jgi:hypothetical protein
MSLRIKKVDVIIIVAMIVVAGFVLIKTGYIPEVEKPVIPNIEFIKDDVNKILIVKSVQGEVLWSEIEILGDYDPPSFGQYVSVGDRIINCIGTIIIRHPSTDTTLKTYKFTPRPPLPHTANQLIPSDVSPVDEGAHYKEILIKRELWCFTVVFSDNSDLAGWVATISFNHMAQGDLFLKPDMLVVTLHGPNGEEYGGVINKQRYLGIFRQPFLKAETPGLDVKYDKSWAKGEAPNWHVHAEDQEIDKDHEIIIDLQYFAPSSPMWTYSSRTIDKGEGKIAGYMFTGCQVAGTVEINGLKHEVNGVGHHEHAWSAGPIKSLIYGWDWCHFTLENGWNIYYSNYYLTKQLIEVKTYKINPFAMVVITTDQGETKTILEDVEIKIEKSERILLLLKMPTEIGISAQPKLLSQPLLRSYEIQLDVDITPENTYDEEWPWPTHLGMKIGRSTLSGKISWSDENGDFSVDLNGVGTIWNMRH